MEKNKDKFKNHLDKIKYYSRYNIGESAKYRPIIDIDEEFDDLPTAKINSTMSSQPMPIGQNLTMEQDVEDAEQIQGRKPTEFTSDQNIDMSVDNSEEQPIEEPEEPEVPEIPEMPEVPTEDDIIANEKNVNELQNDIIKHNIEALKNIHTELENLNSLVNNLNSQVQNLDADVEEVREPTNSEKLMSKKNVSYPYYFNLNDFWKGNWFDEKRNELNEKGIKQLPDGTYVADFDELPQKSKIDIQNSFNEI